MVAGDPLDHTIPPVSLTPTPVPHSVPSGEQWQMRYKLCPWGFPEPGARSQRLFIPQETSLWGSDDMEIRESTTRVGLVCRERRFSAHSAGERQLGHKGASWAGSEGPEVAEGGDLFPCSLQCTFLASESPRARNFKAEVKCIYVLGLHKPFFPPSASLGQSLDVTDAAA